MTTQASSSVDILEQSSRVLTLVAFAIAVVAFIVAPLLAIAWQQEPFPGFLVEQSLVISGNSGHNWGPLEVGIAYPERVTRVAGQSVRTAHDFNRVLASLEDGDQIPVFTISPDGSSHLYPSVELIRISGGDMLRLFWLPYFVGSAYLGIGAWIYRLRGQTRPGRALAFFCAVIAITTMLICDLSTTHVMILIWTFAVAHIGGALISLAWRFPEEWFPVRYQPAVLAFPYVISLGLGTWGVLAVADTSHPWRYIPTWGASYRYAALGILLFIAMMIYRAIASKNGTVRKQARLMTAGSIIAFLPITWWLIAPLLNRPFLFDPVLLLPGLIFFPLSVAMAILRFRLLEVDDFVNHAFVYGASTAILAGVFAALTGLTQRMFVAMTGAKSDAAIIISTLIIASAFTPLRARVQSLVDRRLRDAPDNTEKLRAFGNHVQTFVQMNDVIQLTQRLLTEAIEALHAESGVLSLLIEGRFQRIHTVGRWKEQVSLSVPLDCGGQRYGLIQLGPHRLAGPYTQAEGRALQLVASQVAQAVSLAWSRYEGSHYQGIACADVVAAASAVAATDTANSGTNPTSTTSTATPAISTAKSA
jgi:hypothetical protein